MCKRDDKKLESLTNQLVKLMDKIYKAQKILTQLEDDSDNLLRKLLRTDAHKK